MMDIWSAAGFFGVTIYLLWKELLPRWRAWRKKTLSRSWPLTETKFDSGEVKPLLVQVDGGSGTLYRLEAILTYGDTTCPFKIRYENLFRDLREAELMLTSLRQGPTYVRYNPLARSEYVFDPYNDVRGPASAISAG
jgi:hypothetical protein